MPSKAPPRLVYGDDREALEIADLRLKHSYGFNGSFRVRQIAASVSALLREIEADFGINPASRAVEKALRDRLTTSGAWDVEVPRLPSGEQCFVRVCEKGRPFGSRGRERSDHLTDAAEGLLGLLAFCITQTGVLMHEDEAKRYPRGAGASLLRNAELQRSFSAMQRELHEAGHPQKGFEEGERIAAELRDEAQRRLRDPQASSKGGRPPKRPAHEVLVNFSAIVRHECALKKPKSAWDQKQRDDFAMSLRARLSAAAGTQLLPPRDAIAESIWRADGRLRAKPAMLAEIVSRWFRCSLITARNWIKTGP